MLFQCSDWKHLAVGDGKALRVDERKSQNQSYPGLPEQSLSLRFPAGLAHNVCECPEPCAMVCTLTGKTLHRVYSECRIVARL